MFNLVQNNESIFAYVYFGLLLGHNNIVALTGKLISSDDALRLLTPEERNCLFYDETSNLYLYNTYTQSNCYFECFIKLAQEFSREKFNITKLCVPWYFPTPEANPNICDPWESVVFQEKFLSASTANCKQCLPDCETTVFKSQVLQNKKLKMKSFWTF